MSDFKGVSEKFRVSLQHSDGQTERVVVQIGLDGLKVLSTDGSRTLKSFDLSHISRWQSRGSSLILYTKTPVDVEERQMTLQGDDNTIRSTLDTLTSCCMQLVELLQSKKTDTSSQETANNLHALVAGGGKKKTPAALPAADDVEYWKSPDKAGWLQCQGDVIKSWRKRWFVLKQGHLFRFMNDTVTSSTKPRGVVDLSKVQDVKPANTVTGRANSIQIKTASGGSVCYIADSETEVVEWISALEGAIARICKLAAGEPDVVLPPPKSSSTATAGGGTSSNAGGGSSSAHTEWAKQLERNFANMSTSSSRGGDKVSSSSARDRGGSSSARHGGGDGGGSSSRGRDSAYSSNSPYAALAQQAGVGMEYSQIAGAGLLSNSSHSDAALDDMSLNYGSRGGGGGGGGGGNSSAAAAVPSAYASQVYGGQSVSNSQQYGVSQSSYGYAGGQGYGQPQQQQQAPQQTMSSYGAAYDQSAAGGGMSSYGSGNIGSSYGGGGGYGGGGYGGSSAPRPQPGGSLIDQMPQQQPAYPTYFQHAASAPVAQQTAQQPQSQLYQVPQQPSAGWQAHYTAEGRPYYYNAALGTTQWDMPVGYA